MTELPPPIAFLATASPSLVPLLELGARAAESEAPVLILGEPGSGRTTLARGLHGSSRRRAGPLVEVDPGSLPSSLFESELFGHLAGAFTGAEESVEGRVARAENGTLLLDHVEETPIAAQAKLLRLLAEQRYAPLGGQDRRANVRFMAIGSSDLPRRIESGAFRSDLFYRLEVLTLRLPPLRSRMDDLPALIGHFLDDLGDRFGRGRLRLAAEARAWMETYEWPGNLRELRNVLEREVLMTEGDLLDPRPRSTAKRAPEPLATVEKRQIMKALEHTRGHQGRAAELLGISRKALWEKRRRLGLP